MRSPQTASRWRQRRISLHPNKTASTAEQYAIGKAVGNRHSQGALEGPIEMLCAALKVKAGGAVLRVRYGAWRRWFASTTLAAIIKAIHKLL